MSVNDLTFGFLDEQSPEKAISGAYYALRLIRHRERITDLNEELFVPDASSEPSTDERHIAFLIIREIERAEGVSVLKFSEQKAQEYSSRLSKLIQQSASRRYGRNRDKGRELLVELRATF